MCTTRLFSLENTEELPPVDAGGQLLSSAPFLSSVSREVANTVTAETAAHVALNRHICTFTKT